MEIIKVKEELAKWVVDYITNTVHGLEAEDSEEFNKWAKSFEREEAEFVVNMEFGNDWAYDEREEITIKEATEYANSLLKVVLDNWYR